MLVNHSLSAIGRGVTNYHARYPRRSVTPRYRDLNRYAVNFGAVSADLPKAPPGYQWVYEPDGLGELGKFRLKKIFKKLKKIVKKVAPIVAIGTAAYLGFPVLATLAKTVAGGMMSPQQAAVTGAAQVPGTDPADLVAFFAAQAANAKAAKNQALLQQRAIEAEQHAEAVRANQEAIRQQRMEQEQARQAILQQQARAQTQSSSNLPAWLLPAVMGGAALLLSLKS